MIKAIFTGALGSATIDQIFKLGFNTVFISHKNLRKDLISKLENKGIKIYVEFGVFAGKEWWEKYPDCRPVDQNGRPAKLTNWYAGVCPNHPQLKKEKLQLIESIVKNHEIDGLWLDFIRYPCHWEEVRNTNITEYCFCPICLKKYNEEVGAADFNLRSSRAKKTSEVNQELTQKTSEVDQEKSNSWIQWKCNQITNFVADISALIHRLQGEFPQSPHWRMSRRPAPERCGIAQPRMKNPPAVRLSGSTALSGSPPKDSLSKSSVLEEASINQSGKNIKLGMFSVPWTKKDYNKAIKKIIGQNFEKLADYIDVFSPMVYHKMCDRKIDWIHEMIVYMDKLTKKPILPIIQTEDKPTKISKEEFRKSIKMATKRPSKGVIIFFLEDLLKDKNKLQVLL